MSVRVLFHATALAHYAFVIYYDLNYVNFPNKSPVDIPILKGRVKYLTFLNVLLQAVFFTVCFLNDIAGTDSSKKRPLIKRLRDTLLPCLAFPLSMFVGLTFWALYVIDRELVLPKAIDPYFPLWLNHAMHTNIMVFILLELITQRRTYPSRKFGLSVLSAFMIAYLVWIHVIFSYTGLWVYPVLDAMNLPMRCMFFVGLLSLSITLYLVGEMTNSAIWKRVKKH